MSEQQRQFDKASIDRLSEHARNMQHYDDAEMYQDGQTILDLIAYAALTPAPQDQQAKAVRAHIQKMQSYVREYLEPGPYVAKHSEGGTFNEPHPHQDEAYAYFMCQQMREAVLNDLIYMLDGPEERAALAPQAEADVAENEDLTAFLIKHAPQTEAAPSRDEALREALEPFAKAADIRLCGEWQDHESISRTDVAFFITFGDLRRARAALEDRT